MRDGSRRANRKQQWQWRVKNRPDQKHEDHTLWEELPDDLWETIFASLAKGDHKNVSLVCKRFLSLSNRSLTDFFIPLLRLKDKVAILLPRLFCRFTQIKIIELCGPDRNLDVTLAQITNSNLPLESLRLFSQTNFSKEAMSMLGRSMSKTIKSLYLDFRVMDDEDLAVVANYFPYLEKLTIEATYDDGITDAGIFEISTKLKSLVSLKISSLYHLSNRSFKYLASNCTLLRKLSVYMDGYICNIVCLNLFGSLSHLTTVELGGHMFYKGILASLSQANLKLEKLSLNYDDGSVDVDGAYFCQFLKSFGHLRYLKLSSFMFPFDINANDFTTSIPNIQKLDLFFGDAWSYHDLPPATLFYLLKNCQLLEEIDICGNLKTHRQNWRRIPTQRSLRTLHFEDCEDLTDKTLLHIVSVCPKLDSLSIEGSSKISERGVKALIRSCNNIKFYKYDEECDSLILSSEKLL